MNKTTNTENLKDEHVIYKIYQFHAIFDVAYKNEKQARQIEDENGSHKDSVRPVYIILSEKEYEEEADFFPIENYQAFSNYNYEVIKNLYFEDFARECKECEDLLDNGFLVDDTDWYCSKECLHKKFSEVEYLEMYDNEQAFWTELL
ncbi:hypothetical protein MKX73_19275 [Solibacillus sp. FSL W7-1436]|uniref:hypothetical protein n=1 Tax=Solibacillus sp. FSL W7-1436 TaxID=2921705 RepID=UPI0030F6DA67